MSGALPNREWQELVDLVREREAEIKRLRAALEEIRDNCNAVARRALEVSS